MNIGYYRNLVILAGLGPILMLSWDAWHDQLGANAANNAIHITGILSLVFLFLSLVVTPIRLMTGWNSIIAYRRALGLYGFAYAFIHFGIYVLLDRMGSLSSTIDEIASRRFLLVGFIALVIMLPLAVTSTNAMIRRMGPARWKLLHRLAYAAAILGVIHYYMLVKSDVRQPLVFAAVLTPILGFRLVHHYIDLRRKSNAPQRQPSTTTAIKKFWTGDLSVSLIRYETHDVKTFRFTNPAGDIPFVHKPGQYLIVSIKVDGKEVKRCYTISSSPTQRGYVEITVKRNPNGVGSQALHDTVQSGDQLRISAPAGKFFFDDQGVDGVVLIAGGVGITPLMSILRYLTDRVWTRPIYFINAVRTSSDLIYEAELRHLAEQFANVKMMHFYSQSPSDKSRESINGRWHERSGYINGQALAEFIPDILNLPIYLCGPDAMMLAVRQSLSTIGVLDKQIATEEFVTANRTVDTPAEEIAPSQIIESSSLDGHSTINFSDSGRTVEIDSSTTILEAAEQADVSLPWECRSGICGQCKVRCESGKVKMANRDAITNDEIGKGFILACQSHAVDKNITIKA
ncbi:MAG: FAD-binding oxidoreductase [Pirellula sp.]|nr:FAD-binding oxidoreductase [Pirellula sp.]